MKKLNDAEEREIRLLRVLADVLAHLEKQPATRETIAARDRVRLALDQRSWLARVTVEQWGREQGRTYGSGFYPDVRAWRFDLGDGLVAEVDEIGERLDVRHPLVGNMKIEGHLTPRRVRAHLRKVVSEVEKQRSAR